ncbi:MAG: sortase [Candidatus Gracilibacteria bacterium]|nr:sortase [Candidatus Gracilibacteria bacterium]
MINLISTIVLVSTMLNQSSTTVDLSEILVSYVQDANQEVETQIAKQQAKVERKVLKIAEIQNEIKAIKVEPLFNSEEIIASDSEVSTPNEEKEVPAEAPKESLPAQANFVNTPSIPSPPVASQNVNEVPIGVEYRLIIPKISVNAPIIDTDIFDEASWKEDLLKGIGHYGGDPGKGSKIVLTAHSSWWVPHEYGEIFRYLYKLEAGDQIYIDYAGERYTYEVLNQEVVGPNTPSIVSNYGYEELVLFTCYPYNSWTNRLVVYTKKI